MIIHRAYKIFRNCSCVRILDIFHPLGMPLHAEEKRHPIFQRPLDRFDDTIRRGGRHHQTAAELVDRLVMDRIHLVRAVPRHDLQQRMRNLVEWMTMFLKVLNSM